MTRLENSVMMTALMKQTPEWKRKLTAGQAKMLTVVHNQSE